MTAVLFGYEISMTVSFVPLRDFNNGCFFNERLFTKSSSKRFKLLVLFSYEISMMVVLFNCEISMMVSFVSLFFYDISKTFGFVSLRDLNDGQFCSFTRFQ